jgi:GntR family transcriptional regulator
MLILDHNSSIPLRAQVEQVLRNLIRQPDYQDNALLPDEVTLAAQMGVSRGTVRSGISKLVFEGLLERKAGVGTRVSHKHVESGIHAWRSFTREMLAKGITVQNFRVNLNRAPASEPAARALMVAPETQLWRLDRLRGWNDVPVLYTVSWFHPRLGLKGTEDFRQPLYEVLESETGARAHHAREEFLAIGADAHLVKLLQVPRNSPLLLRRHAVFDTGNRPIEFAEVNYVSSRFTLTLDMRRGQ